jgi:hypothetical protein
MSTSYNFKNIIAIDNSNNLNINSANNDIYLNCNNSGSNTFVNVNNSNNVIVASKLGIGFNNSSNITANLTLIKNGYIGINTTQGTNDGFLGLSGSHTLSNSTGSRMILYGVDNTTGSSGKVMIYSGNTTTGTINMYTGSDSLKFTITTQGSSLFTPNGSSIVCSITDQISTFTNIVKITNTEQSNYSSTGALQVAGGIGVRGNCVVEGTLSINSVTGNINFNSSQPSTSYSSGAITITGGFGISNSTNAVSVTSGGGMSVAGGIAVGKNMIVGGNIVILDSTVSTNSQDGSLVLYGGLGINNATWCRSNTSSQFRIAPITDGNETSISFFSTNNFNTTSTGASSSWSIGQNVGNISSGNFGIYSLQSGTILTAIPTGDIGINTSVPTYNLDVNGTGRFTGPLFASNNSNTIGNIFTNNGNVGIGNNSPSYTLDVSGTGRITGGITTGSIRSLSTNTVIINGGYGQGSFPYSDSNWGFLLRSPNATPGLADFQFENASGVARFTITSQGNVGIGTINPAYTLDVAGPGRFNTLNIRDISQQFINFYYSTNTVGNIRALNNSTVAGLIISGGGGNSQFVLTSQGNVGIGTNSPTVSLHVNSNNSIGNILLNNAIGGGVLQYIDINHGIWGRIGFDGATDVFDIYEYGKIRFYTGGVIDSQSLRMVIGSTGNVGIGNNSPSYTLDVGGQFNVNSGSTDYPFNITQNLGVGNGNGYPHIGGAFNSGLLTGDAYNFKFGQSSSNRNAGYMGFTYNSAGSTTNYLTFGLHGIDRVLNINGNGNVGIGTTAPSFTLDVSGTGRFTGGITTGSIRSLSTNTVIINGGYGQGSFPYSDTDWGFLLRSPNATPGLADFQFENASGVARLTITSSGNVGIGTSSPSFQLDVDGVTRIKNTLDASDTSTGALIISGGVGIGKNLYIYGPTLKIPSGGTGARPINPTRGTIRYNTDSDQFEGFGAGDSWGSLGGVIDVSQTTKILAEEYAGANDGNLRFITVNEERMRINSSGNIGIGTSSPSSILHINANNKGSIQLGNNDSTGWYMEKQTNGNLSLNTGPYDSGTTRLSLNSIGNTGIGIMNASYKLDVNGDAHIATDLYVDGQINGSGNSASTFALLTLTATDEAINLSTGSLLTFGGITIQCETDATNSTNGGSFLTAGGGAISKNLIVGQNITAANIKINSSIQCTSLTSTYNSIGSLVIFDTIQSTGVGTGGSLTVLGGASISKDVYVGGILTSASDIRLKSNITPLDNNILDMIDNIRTIKHTYINDPEQQSHIGFIAQDFIDHFPELLRKPDDGYYTLDYSKITVILMECIKELKNELHLLKSNL